MTNAPVSLSQTLLRGIACKCPRCGRGKLFEGFLSLRPSCSACGLDYAFIDAGDGPAVFIILIAGFIVVFCALIVEVIYQPPRSEERRLGQDRRSGRPVVGASRRE